MDRTGYMMLAALIIALLNASWAECLFQKKRIDERTREKRQKLWGLGIIFIFGLLDMLLGWL